MTREQFVTEHLDELVGLLMRSFAATAPYLGDEKNADMGRRMRLQMVAARDFLGRVFDSAHPPAPAPPNGHAKPAQPARN